MTARLFLRIFAAVLFTASLSAGQVSVLTQHNDISRTGQNLNETVLSTSNVNVSNFGKLFSRAVDGYIYAQPLYVPGLSIAGKVRNVVFVATEHNSVYAFDGDDPAASASLWAVSLGTSVPSGDVCIGLSVPECPYADLTPEIGITATPVIDLGTGTIYVVAKTKDTTNNTYHFKLHALDLLTGTEKFGGPVEISASVPGTGAGSSGGSVKLLPLYENNRPGLLLLNGVVYIAFGSVGDVSPFHGWVLGYNASTLAQVAVYCTTPNGSSGGIWGGGQGLLADADNLYVTTSNGSFDVNTGGTDYGDSIVKLGTSTGLSVLDYFTPDNQSYLSTNNVDLGSGGPLMLPGTSLLAGAGKDGILRLLDSTTGKMGGFNATFDADLQEFQATSNTGANSGFMGGPVYWNSPNQGPLVYIWGAGDFLKAYQFSNNRFVTSPFAQSTIQGTAGYSNSVPLSLSANGSQAGTGILWASEPFSGDANEQAVTGILRAFDATNLSELWNSNQYAARDAVGNYAKFTPPTVANGKVYLGTFSKQLLAYGLNPPPPSGIGFVQQNSATPQSPTSAVAVPFSLSQGPGDLNIVVVGWNDTTSAVQSVSDSAGNSYTLAVGPSRGTGVSQAIYYAKSIKAGSNTVSVAFKQAAVYPDIRILEYSGLDTVSPLDVVSAAVGSGTSSNSGTASTTAAADLIFGANTVSTGTTGPGAGFTARVNTRDGDIAEDKTTTATGSYSASAPISPSGNWVMQMVALKQVGSTAGTAPTVTGISPPTGPTAGGTSVTISGTNFAAGATVSFGGTAASNVTVTSSTTLTAVTPAHAAGTVDVIVTDPNGLSGTLTGGFTYSSSTATIGFSQVAAATPQAAVATVSVTFPSTQTAGDLNVVVVGWNDITSMVSSVQDSKGNSYALAVAAKSNTKISQAIYYAKNIAVGSNTVTVSFNQAASWPDIRILEYKGLDTVSPLDVTASSAGNSATASSGSATTTVANELLVGADTVWTGNAGAGTGFTVRIITSPDSDLAEDQTVTTTGSYAATAPLTASGYWVMQMAAFKAAGSSGGTPPTVTGISPSSGAANGGTNVTITGTNFTSGATVAFGGANATNVVVTSSTTLTATTPAHAAGTVNVVVTNPNTLSGTLSGGFTYTAATSTISFVQVAAATPQASVISVPVAYLKTQTSGNMNVVVIGWNDSVATVSSVTDSAGNVYTAATPLLTGTNIRQIIYYAAGIKGGSNTVTVTFNQAAAWPDVRILEYSGVSTPDVIAGAAGNSSSASSGSATTSSNELIFGADTVYTGNSGPGTGFTARIITSPDSDLAEDRSVTSTGSYSATAPLTGSGPWVMQMVTFK